MFKKLSEKEKDEIIPILGKISDMEISRLYGVGYGIIFRLRKKLKISAKPLSKEPNIDVHCFDIIDHISAYWIGYLFSDGCLYKDKNRNIISLLSIDEEVIKKFSIFLNYTIDYRTSKKNDKGLYSLAISNKYLYNKLEEYGLSNKKTFNLKIPNINSQYIFSFLLGYFDGDGSISYHTKINSWTASIGFASLNFYNWFNSILEDNNIIYNTEKNRKTNTEKPFYITSMNGISAQRFLKLCYENVPLHIPLERKLVKAKQLFSIQKFAPPRFQNWEIDAIETMGIDKGILFINEDNRNYGWKRGKESTARVLKRKGIIL
jgi:hypothetical protein